MTALACVVCLLANAKDKAAYAFSAAFMSLVPLAAVGLLVWWYRKATLTDELNCEDDRRLKGS